MQTVRLIATYFLNVTQFAKSELIISISIACITRFLDEISSAISDNVICPPSVIKSIRINIQNPSSDWRYQTLPQLYTVSS